MSNPFDLTSRYYDLLYREKDTQSEVSYIDSLLRRYNPNCSSILEFGSGTGRHGRLLAESGYQIHGIERSPAMVASAAITPGFTCQQGDIASTFLNKTYDSVISIFHVLSYQTSNSQVSSFFSNAARHLNSGGLFLFDFWFTPAVISNLPEVRIKRLKTSDLSIIRIAEPVIHVPQNIVDVHYTLLASNTEASSPQTVTELHPMRHFSIPELSFIASSHGFEILTAEEWLTGSRPSLSTWGVCLVLQKL